MTTNTPPAPNHANKRTPAARAADREFIAKLAVKSFTEEEITTALNAERDYKLSRSQIHADLSKLRQEWSESAADDIGEQCGLELARLNHLEQVAWEGFDKSHEAQWLGLVLKASGQRVALLGLARPIPQRLELSAPDGQTFQYAQLVVPERGTLDRDA